MTRFWGVVNGVLIGRSMDDLELYYREAWDLGLRYGDDNLLGSLGSDSFELLADVPEVTGRVLPAWVTHAWEDPGVADGAPISTHTDLISGVVAASSGTARPLWREDYAGTGVAAVEWDGVNDVMLSTSNVDFTGGFTYCALVYFAAPLANYPYLFEHGTSTTTPLGGAFMVTSAGQAIAFVRSTGYQDLTYTGIPTGQWMTITLTVNGVSSALYVNRTLVASGTLNLPTVANYLRFGRGNGGIFARGGMKGAIAAHYFGPPASPAQRTEIWDYVNDRHGVAL